MRVIRHCDELSPVPQGRVVALGNFDGVHLGHQAVISAARDLARDLGALLAVMSFEPHPRLFFQPDLPPFRLTPFRVKTRLIEELGADTCLLQHFDAEFASRSAEAFVTDLLVTHLGVKAVVVGHDYVFGKGRGGNPDLLRRMGAALGFAVTVVDAATAPDGEIYSSTRVRDHLANGRPREAARLLGRPWEIEGRVEHGDQRGRTIGFPTANLRLEEYQRPAFGVYAVQVGWIEGHENHWQDGVANIGRRPTFGKLDDLLETHVFDYQGDLYGRHVHVRLMEYLRPEQKFSGLDELKRQIETDATQARALLKSGS